MPAPTSGSISLSAHIHTEYQKTPTVPAGFAASYHKPVSFTTGRDMSRMLTGVPIWDGLGDKTAAHNCYGATVSTGSFPYQLPYGTFKILGSPTDYNLKYSRTLIPGLTNVTGIAVGTRPNNIKFSDYYGTFFPFYSNLVLNSAGTTTYTIGAGLFWIKAVVVGGGGGGGGSDICSGGAGGAGAKTESTFYVVSCCSSQALRFTVGAGGGGGAAQTLGPWYCGGAGTGGSGYATGGTGGLPGRAKFSGRGGGGGGSSAIEWLPNGSGGTGYLLVSAGGGGGGGGAGQFYNSQSAGTFAAAGCNVAGGGAYGLYGGSANYAGYSGTGNSALNTGYTLHTGFTCCEATASCKGYNGVGGADLYTYYYKTYIRCVYGGVFNCPFGVNGYFCDALYNDNCLNELVGIGIDTGGAGGGGGGYGNPGFLPPSFVYDLYGDGSCYTINYTNIETIGGGGMEGLSFVRDNITGQSTFEYAFRNRRSSYSEGRTPPNDSPFQQILVAGQGGAGGTNGSGTNGFAGAVSISITNADNEYSLFSLTSI